MNRKFNLRGNEMMYIGSSYYEDIVPAKKSWLGNRLVQ